MPKPPNLVPNYIGIDPGEQGGIAVISRGILQLRNMPKTDRDLLDSLTIYDENNPSVAVLEKVGGYIRGKSTGPAMFNFGTGYGALRMGLTAAGISFELITPQVWQKALGIPKRLKTETNAQWKNRLKAKAQQLFPKATITLAVADAVLIAEFCRRKYTGRI